jgi:triosephosphate isomerase (TIM)
LFHFIINSKNYENAAGETLVSLASDASAVGLLKESIVRVYLAVPAFSVSELANRFSKIEILAQHLDNVPDGSTTGYLVPKIAKLSGARGSLLNHSEHRLANSEIQNLVGTLRNLELKSIVCAQDQIEVERFAALSPDFIAIEPPELIGSGNAVSKARPSLITDCVKAVERGSANSTKPTLLCGAGIVEPEDVTAAVRLGAEGILVASGVIKAKNWKIKIDSLARAFTDV